MESEYLSNSPPIFFTNFQNIFIYFHAGYYIFWALKDMPYLYICQQKWTLESSKTSVFKGNEIIIWLQGITGVPYHSKNALSFSHEHSNREMFLKY